MSYDSLGRLAVLRDTMERMTTFAYDDADRLVTRILPGERQVAFGYDAASNLTSLTPPGRTAHGFDYNPVDLTSHYRPPGAGMADSLTQYVFNLDRQLTHLLRPDSSNITPSYGNTTGRIEEVTTPRGDAAFTYDGAGRLSTLGSPDGVTLTYSYDGPIPIQESWGGSVGGSVSISLDSHFRPEAQQVNGGNSASYTYDRDGLITAAGDLAIMRSASNGLITGTSLGSVTTTETANGFGEVDSSAVLLGGATLWGARYARDAAGRITGITETVLGITSLRAYAYSDTGFLTTVWLNGTVVERYGYDGNGNRVRFDAPGVAIDGLYDAQDRLTRYGSTRYAYTAAGELLERVDSTGAGFDTTRYTYDPLGNLVKVQLANGDSIEYLIDGRNRRVARKLNGAVTSQWLYQDQLEPVAEFDGAGNLVARYVYGTRGHVPDYVVKGDSTYRIVADHLGSVRLVVNVVNGWVAQRLDYDGYGRITLDTSPGFQCFSYAGGLWDASTGLVRFGARDYEAEVGRWTSRDPIGFSGGDGNLTAYCAADPINLIDPTGTRFSDFGRGAVTGFYCAALATGAIGALVAILPVHAAAAVTAAAIAFGAVSFAVASADITAQLLDPDANTDERDSAIGELFGGMAFGGASYAGLRGFGPQLVRTFPGLFDKGRGLNRGPYLRIGRGGSSGKPTFRVVIDHPRWPIHKHIIDRPLR